MKQVNQTDLIKVLDELQDLCDFEPKIITKGKSYSELIDLLDEAFKSLMFEDEFSKLAVTLFKDLGLQLPKGDRLAMNDDWIHDAKALNDRI